MGIFWSSGRYYVKRGEHLGKFRQCADAVAAAKALARANAFKPGRAAAQARLVRKVLSVS